MLWAACAACTARTTRAWGLKLVQESRELPPLGAASSAKGSSGASWGSEARWGAASVPSARACAQRDEAAACVSHDEVEPEQQRVVGGVQSIQPGQDKDVRPPHATPPGRPTSCMLCMLPPAHSGPPPPCLPPPARRVGSSRPGHVRRLHPCAPLLTNHPESVFRYPCLACMQPADCQASQASPEKQSTVCRGAVQQAAAALAQLACVPRHGNAL